VIPGTKAGSLAAKPKERKPKMCGIVGYVGMRNAPEVLLEGLKRLEYRGYDSAGMAVRSAGRLEVIKEVGKVADLERLVAERQLEGSQGIGHTRWATHGGGSVDNAHPHCDDCGNFVLVHNGIIENYMDLREELEASGVQFCSETDTEVIVQLLARLYRGDMLEALLKLVEKLRGSYALAIMNREIEDTFYCLRKGSPLVLGVADGEGFCASDVPALLPYTRQVAYLEEGEIAAVSKGLLQVWTNEGVAVEKAISIIDWDISMTEKAAYPHFMLKEIHEQGAVLRTTLKGRVENGRVDLSSELGWDPELVGSWKKLHIVACGTSFYAALVAERVLEKWTDLEVKVDIASEYRYRHSRADADTLGVFVSQSGETADTLAAQRLARSQGAHCLAVTNVRGSTLAREVHDVLLLKAGPEIGVAATKTFMGQIAALYLLALYLGRMRETLTAAEENRLLDEILRLPYKVEVTLEREESIRELAGKYADRKDFLFLGRGISFPIALEGALKLKEISYVHAEAYAAGEMKHGPIALLEPAVPVMTIIPRDGLYEKTLSNIQEAKARRSPILALATDGDDLIAKHASAVIRVPWTDEDLTPFLTVVPLQLFAYHMAKLRGCEIDQPRNLAKSVTVE
jgi:glucosamine--fructose-6-phosphate aminotransferase (isomerizing)